MPNISQMASDLRALPDQALASELQNPTGLVPSYLVLGELQRRQLMRQAAQKQQQQGSSGSVLDDVVRSMQAQQPPQGLPPAPAGMTPPRMGQAPMPGAMTPQQMGMAQGGVIRKADGGDMEDDDTEDDGGTDTALGPFVDLGRTGTPAAPTVDDWIDKYSTQFGVNPNMARAIMAQESGGKKDALSNKGAIGRFQLMPGTARDLGVDPNDPEDNVKGGIQYFSQLRKRYGGDDRRALAAYNAGPGAVDRYGGIPPFEQTQNYVPAVLGRFEQLNWTNPPLSSSARQLLASAVASAAPQAGAAAPETAAPETAAPQTDAATGDAARADQDQTTPTFEVTAHPGRIHQNIDDLEKQKAGILDQMGKLPDPYAQSNIRGMLQDRLDNLTRVADMRAATINQLQGQVLQRYQNPNPWEFLARIGAGMGASRSLSLPLMFAEGVGQAWQARDADEQRQMQDYDALEKMREGIYSGVESQRGRMDQIMAGLAEHQANTVEANRKLLQDQFNRLNTEQNQWKAKLVPSNKLEPLSNPDDYSSEDVTHALDLQAKAHGWNTNRQQVERAAIQALAARGDQWVPGGQFGSAYDQFLAKYPGEAQMLDVKASKFAPSDIASFAQTAAKEPAALYDPKVVPKDAVTAVRAYMTANNMRVPVQPPNKTLHDSAALATRTLAHLDRLNAFAQDPWMVENVFGPWAGRMAKGEEQVGMDQLALKGATPQQTRDTQNLLTSLNYLRMLEGKGLLGGRPAAQLMQQLMATSPDVHQTINRFLGAMDATRASANLAIQADRDHMYGTQSINTVPAGAQVAQDASGRRIMRTAPGQPWRFMDTGEVVK